MTITCLVCRQETTGNDLGLHGNGVFRAQFVPNHICQSCAKLMYELFVAVLFATKETASATQADNIRRMVRQLETEAPSASDVVRDLLEEMDIDPGETL